MVLHLEGGGGAEAVGPGKIETAAKGSMNTENEFDKNSLALKNT